MITLQSFLPQHFHYSLRSKFAQTHTLFKVHPKMHVQRNTEIRILAGHFIRAYPENHCWLETQSFNLSAIFRIGSIGRESARHTDELNAIFMKQTGKAM